MLKKCSKCSELKERSEFFKNSKKPDGLRYECKACNHSMFRSSKKQKAARALRVQKWRSKNKEKNRELHRSYYLNDPKRHIGYISKYRAAVVRATPKWLTEGHLVELRWAKKVAQNWTKSRGQEYTIDHIVPIQGREVCGLNVPWNLQIITKSENSRKSNNLQGSDLF